MTKRTPEQAVSNSFLGIGSLTNGFTTTLAYYGLYHVYSKTEILDNWMVKITISGQREDGPTDDVFSRTFIARDGKNMPEVTQQITEWMAELIAPQKLGELRHGP